MRKKRVSEKDRWLYLFKEGRNIDTDNPPDILKNSKEMRDVMEILNGFSENQRDYLLYQKRLEGERVRQTILSELEKERKEKEKERMEKEKAWKEIERLKKLLKK